MSRELEHLERSLAVVERLDEYPYAEDDPPEAPLEQVIWLLDRAQAMPGGVAENGYEDFAEFAGTAMYPALCELAAAAAALDPLLEQLRPVFEHELVAGDLRHVSDLQLVLAEALAAEGNFAAALELAERTFAQQRDAGIEPETLSLAIALGYLVDLGRADDAEDGFRDCARSGRAMPC
jgi:tetratricopeptide (TPR) repeat protein